MYEVGDLATGRSQWPVFHERVLSWRASRNDVYFVGPVGFHEDVRGDIETIQNG
jgi:hypothetical protein